MIPVRAPILAALLLAIVLILALTPNWASGQQPVQRQTLIEGKPIEWWRARAVINRREANQQRRNSEARGRTIRRLQRQLTVRHSDSSLEAIAYAATAYGVSYTTLRRKAYCETGGTFNPYAKNPSSTASGLFQFLTSTWATTPYARFSIWDPYANALAAGWMHANGRGGEWACR